METVALARVIGIFLLALGVFRLTNRQIILEFLGRFFAKRVLTYWYGVIALPVSIGLIVTQTRFDSLLTSTISLLSWFLLVEAVAYMCLPQRSLDAIYRALQRDTIYTAVAVSFVLVGCYLLLATMF